ncbi:MAG: hypothetical protein ACKVKG_17885, partial [Alphaproteobacteria bacterium]
MGAIVRGINEKQGTPEMAVDLAQYAQSRISPFDEQALRLLLASRLSDFQRLICYYWAEFT